MFQIWTHDIGGQKYIFLGCVERGHHIDSCWNNHSFGRPSPRGQESDQATRSWPGTCQSWWGNWLPWWACTSPRTYRACTPWEEEEGCKEVGKIPGLPPTLVGGERTSTQQADGGARCSLHSSSCQELLRKSVWMWTMWLCFRHTAWSESAHRQKAQEHWSSSRWRTWSVSCPLRTRRWSTRWHRFNCWRRQREPKRWGGFFINSALKNTFNLWPEDDPPHRCPPWERFRNLKCRVKAVIESQYQSLRILTAALSTGFKWKFLFCDLSWNTNLYIFKNMQQQVNATIVGRMSMIANVVPDPSKYALKCEQSSDLCDITRTFLVNCLMKIVIVLFGIWYKLTNGGFIGIGTKNLDTKSGFKLLQPFRQKDKKDKK